MYRRRKLPQGQANLLMSQLNKKDIKKEFPISYRGAPFLVVYDLVPTVFLTFVQAFIGDLYKSFDLG